MSWLLMINEDFLTAWLWKQPWFLIGWSSRYLMLGKGHKPSFHFFASDKVALYSHKLYNMASVSKHYQ